MVGRLAHSQWQSDRPGPAESVGSVCRCETLAPTMNTETATVDNNAARAERVSSPAATGGAGTFFEQHVDAYLLALLLVRGFPPVLVDGVVSEVLFQTEHLGWKTDDFLVRASVGNGAPRLLAGQAKRNLRVSSGDAEFKQTIRDGWADFSNKEIFSPERDRLAIVIPRGTEALQVHFCALLDCARASRDAADFRHRLETPGFLDKTVAKHFAEVRAVIEATQGEKVGHHDLWPFLRVLHLLVLDLHSSSSQAEALVKSLLSHTTNDPAPAGAANATWDALLRLVSEGMPQATRFRRDDLPAELRQRHTPNARHDEVLLALREHSLPVLSKIRAGLGPGELHIRRDRLVTNVLAAVREHLSDVN